MACYEPSCTNSSKFVCQICGGMVCDSHGRRVKGYNKSYCYECVPSGQVHQTSTIPTQLRALQKVAIKRPEVLELSDEEIEEIKRLDIDALQ